MSEGELLLSGDEVTRAIATLAEAIGKGVPRDRLALVGIRRGGPPIAARVGKLLALTTPVGSVDIALYRDDAATALPDPKIGPSQIPFDVEGRDVVLVDDVLQTGRTVRAAIDCLLDYGRPRRVWLAVLLDRGGRELPIAADFVGRSIPPMERARVVVDVTEGHESVRVERR